MKDSTVSKYFERQKQQLEAALAKQEVVKPLTLERLREKIKQYNALIKLCERDIGLGEDVDTNYHLMKTYQGHVSAFEELIEEMKGLTHREAMIQRRKGKL